MKILELCPDEFGFRQYTDDLVKANADSDHEFLNTIYFQQLNSANEVTKLARTAAALMPDLIHIQHEYGFMGSKIPGKYRFQALVKELRSLLPKTKLVATAHSVIAQDFKYPLQGRGWQIPFRAAANTLLLPSLLQLWNQKTWGVLNGVIVHSRHQLPSIKASGARHLVCIPHYVPNRYEEDSAKSKNSSKLSFLNDLTSNLPVIFVFGYFTPEKGQDLLIQALKQVKTPCHLVLGGGVRRDADQTYFQHCKDLIEKLGLKEQVTITGFLNWAELDQLAARAQLAVLPFRETSGSGSLADLASRGVPILASNLPLNLEISERTPGAMAYYPTGNAEACGSELDRLLSQPKQLEDLKRQISAYRDAHSPEKILRRHLDFFSEVLT